MNQKLLTLSNQHPIILFDGHCMLCSRFIKYVMERDTEERLRFSALQQVYPEGNQLDTVQLLWQGKIFEKSEVLEELTQHIRLPRMLGLLRILPRFIKNLGYDIIARLRYRLIGRSEECMVILGDKAHLFLTKP